MLRSSLHVCAHSKVAKLVGGDAAALLLFGIIGRINHGEVLSMETFNTVLPFWIGEAVIYEWIWHQIRRF